MSKEVGPVGDVAVEEQPRESDTYTDDDPFADLVDEGSDPQAFAFSKFEDEEMDVTKQNETKSSTVATSTSKLKVNTQRPRKNDSKSTDPSRKTEIPKVTEVDIPECSLSPTSLPDITTPQCQLSPPPLEGDENKDNALPQILAADSSRNESRREHSTSYESDGLEEHAARSSYELMSYGSRTTMIIHFSPDEEMSGYESATEDFEDMKTLKITKTCASTNFPPEHYDVQRASYNLDIQPSSSGFNSVEPLEPEVEPEDEHIGEMFEYLHSILQSSANSKALENLSSLQRAFVKKGEAKAALSNEKDDLVTMHLNFVSRVAEEMSNMKMNPCGWVSLSR